MITSIALALSLASQPSELDALLAQLNQSDWKTVRAAAVKLEGWASTDEPVVPKLVANLESKERVPLTDTMDLIYPGAKESFGHGEVIPYDLDSLALRSGWVLESLAFQDFGCAKNAIDADGERAKAASAKAKAWLDHEGRDFKRLAALKDALARGNRDRQLRALSWLRYGETPCAGLDAKTYDAEVKPLVEPLAQTADLEVKEQAALLLKDGSVPAGTAQRTTTTSLSIDAGLVFAVPSQWQAVKTTSKMRQAQYKLGDDAELVVYYFGEGGAGGVEANLERWRGQFQPDEGKDKVEETAGTQQIGGMKATLLELKGRFVAETAPGSGERVDKKGFAMRAAIVEGPLGPVFFKATGPAAILERERERFDAMLKSITSK